MTFTEVADGVLVRTSRRLSTTTTLVLGRAGTTPRPALLVDPCWDPDELAAIADDLASRGVRVIAGLATHAHHDHLLWHPSYGADVTRWASAGTAAVVAARRGELLDELLADGPGAHEEAAGVPGQTLPPRVLALFGRVSALPGGDGPHRTRIPDPQAVLPPHDVVVHDAHAPGHAALWLPHAGVLVAGDMLSDIEIPLPFDPDDLDAYRAGLDRLAPYVGAASVLVPGHGTPSHAPGERLDADRRYLDDVLHGRRVDDPRLHGPGMAAEHARVLRMVAARGDRDGAAVGDGQVDGDRPGEVAWRPAGG